MARNPKLYVLAGLVLPFGVSWANSNIDGLLQEGSHWRQGCAAAAKNFPDFQWTNSGDVWSLKDDKIRLWNRDVQSFQMSSSDEKLRSLKVGILQTTDQPDFMEALETWKAVMQSRLNADGNQASYSTSEGTVLKLHWRNENCLISLKGEENKGSYSLSLQYRPITEPPANVAAEKDRFDGIFERTFYSPDYAKSFRGTVQSYDEGTMVLKIEKGRSIMSVNLDQLSDRDADYIDRVGGLIAAKNGLRLEIVETKEKPNKNNRAISVGTGFDITLVNNSKSKIEDVEIRYDMFHKEDTLDGPPVLKKTSGSFQLEEIFAQYRESNSTEKIEIIRESSPGVSGG